MVEFIAQKGYCVPRLEMQPPLKGDICYISLSSAQYEKYIISLKVYLYDPEVEPFEHAMWHFSKVLP